MRGEKTIELRSIPTKVRGRIYIYAGLKKPDISELFLRRI